MGHTCEECRENARIAVHPHIRGAYSSRIVLYASLAWFIPTYVGHTGGLLPWGRMEPVHPHIRGAYNGDEETTRSGLGSSPHTWGIRCKKSLMIITVRFIPTYVGHTILEYINLGENSVHPHIRGAYFSDNDAAREFNGSSPHTWGILQPPRNRLSSSRFIPTYVGHTLAGRYSRCNPPVHPHIRGAYPTQARSDAPGRGSSPHTWGIQKNKAWQCRNARFIPTYVGHTKELFSRESGDAVHPHIRGAYFQNQGYLVTWIRFIPTYVGHTPFSLVTVSRIGSSPHTWGIHPHGQRQRGRERFIPTYVGHTSRRKRSGRRCTVHPHIRGAYCGFFCISSGMIGSSPHTWGILDDNKESKTKDRFIPTYVGHTGATQHQNDTRSVHPHIRGAYWKMTLWRWLVVGSSPHTWGIRLRHLIQRRVSRFIPTYVGHTNTAST